MSEIKKNPINNLSKNFISSEFKSSETDLFPYPLQTKYRSLNAQEIEILVKNNNFSENWNDILVADLFDPNLVKNCNFFGKIRIGQLSDYYLEYHDLRLPVGIYDSTIISCVFGDNVVIKDVHYLSHYIIGNNCILFNIDEMITTNYAKFGNGILKEGENESIRIWLEICNENGGRKILPFESMIPADAYIWSKFRDDSQLMDRLKEITNNSISNKRGIFGSVGDYTVIKTSRILKDVKIGENAYIKGVNKLKNLTVLSSKNEPTQIGEGVECVNGIIGFGSKIFYGVKAVRFVTGRNTQLKYGARLINSVLGDNSTVSCCELLNNLIFPFHEQHHNNSFLIASTILGQSNVAAGATVGSNHNSRSPDGEIIAGRGFWPGLCTNFKHNCIFASYTLIAKGSYQYEMNIKYPFSLVSQDNNEKNIRIMPGYWFMYNMYAVARNTYKFKLRDKRFHKIQNIEFEYLAPDTVNEILFAIKRIKYLIGLKLCENENIVHPNEELIFKNAQQYIDQSEPPELELIDLEAMKHYGAKIIKPLQALIIYQKMINYYFVKSIINYFKLDSNTPFNDFQQNLIKAKKIKLYNEWKNIGGQLMPIDEIDTLKLLIKDKKLNSWNEIHDKYNDIWKCYPEQKVRHAINCFEIIYGSIEQLKKNDWKSIFDETIDITNKILTDSICSREKDYKDSFRTMNYDNQAEMKSVLGDLQNNPFLDELSKETNFLTAIMKNLLKSIK